MVNLQRQMCQQLEAAQVSLSTPHITESIVVKPTLFNGCENENVDHWLQRFSLHLANGKTSPSIDQAAVRHEKLNEKFNCLDPRNEDKMCYLIQGLRADIQAEVLKKEPKTYTEGEDTARLIYSIQKKMSHILYRLLAACLQQLMQAQLLKYKVLLLEYSTNLIT